MLKTIYKVTGVHTDKVYYTSSDWEDADKYRTAYNDCFNQIRKMWLEDDITRKAYDLVDQVYIAVCVEEVSE